MNESDKVELETERVKLEQSLIDEQYAEIRDAFIKFWREHGGKPSKIGHQHWKHLRAIFKSQGFELPEFYDTTPFSGVVSMMLSAKYGQPVGYANQKLIEVTNVAFNYYKNYLYLFGKALNIYGHMELLKVQDTKGKWAERRKIIRESMNTKKAGYERHTEFDELIFLLLPELPKNLKSLG